MAQIAPAALIVPDERWLVDVPRLHPALPDS